MTYLRDSDVRSDYYGQLLRAEQSSSEQDFVRSTALGKTRMIAWLVSNCNTHSHREKYVAKLKNYVKVDQFGGCTGNAKYSYSCPRNPQIYGDWCSSIPFTSAYRFYIAFENSVCRDYVSEKFYQALDRLMVPIVLRESDYLDIAPKGSYIAADQFRSPKQLAEYLHYLASNPEEYLKYFEWTKRNSVAWEIKPLLENAVCRLCRMLHENETSTISEKDMWTEWKKDAACVQGFASQLL
uniref:Fucosyltransferase n=1 Tax=Plectus sambesii TaxID=2011161 RepID=A0A914VM21_9BILA